MLPETSVVPEAGAIDPYLLSGQALGAPQGLSERAGPAAERYNRAYQLYAEGAYASAEEAFRRFIASDGSDPLAAAALDRFFLTLGAVSGDLALAHGSNAVVLAGGLGYRIRDRFENSGFAGRFVAKGRFERRMQKIPVKLVTHPQPGLYGAAVAFAKEHSE